MKRIASVFIILAIVSSVGFAFEVGDIVVAIHDADLKVDDRTVDKVFPGVNLTVHDIKDNWLWVSNGHPGWLENRHVVPLDQALPVLNEMIRQNPRDARLYYGRGMVRHGKQEYDLAIGDFNEAIRLRPLAVYFDGRGPAWAEKGEYDKAIADFNEALLLDPQYVIAYNNRGGVWIRKGEYHKAIADFSEALRLDPKYVSAYNNRGSARAKGGDIDGAIVDFNEALRLDPKDGPAYNNRGTAWAIRGQFDKAIADFTERLRLGPEDARVYRNRGHAWSLIGEYGNAIADFNELLRLDPTNVFACRALSWAYATCPDERCRNGQKAVEYATKACQLGGWEVAISLHTLAAAYAETGNFPEALKWQAKAIDLAPAAKGVDYQSCLDLYKQGKPYRDEKRK